MGHTSSLCFNRILSLYESRFFFKSELDEDAFDELTYLLEKSEAGIVERTDISLTSVDWRKFEEAFTRMCENMLEYLPSELTQNESLIGSLRGCAQKVFEKGKELINAMKE